ncbi:MAG: CRTAC1 family protein [Xanthomonadales bacterium]|nr:CRTAC1 family protein [Xanthomonadales bacterium]
MSMPTLRCWCVVLCLTAASWPPARAQVFESVSAQAGFQPGFLANIAAGGIAVADFDGNGWPDIFVTGYLQPNRMYFNQGDGTFVEMAEVNAAVAGSYCSVTAAADYDNDGWTDLYVGCRQGGNLLLHNLGGAGFARVTPPELDHMPPSSNGPRTDAVAWGDLTGNGYPDLYIGIYPNSSTPDIDDVNNLDRIVLNHGDGTWSVATATYDAVARAKFARTALAAIIRDFSGDGRADLLVINDKLQGNTLWRNDGPGCGGWCFTDIAESSGVLRPVFGMGVAVGDVDRDGLWDMYVSSIDEQVLFRGVAQQPDRFVEESSTPLDHYGVGWSTVFSDLDNDGWEDAFLAIASAGFSTTSNRDQVFRNRGDGTFDVVSEGSGLAELRPTQPAARIDYDLDGRTDLVLGHWNQGYALYRNVTPAAGHWIGFALEGSGAMTRGALGARVVVRSGTGGCQMRELRAGEARGSSHQPVLHFGLGTRTQAQATVYWPDGRVQRLGMLAADSYHALSPDTLTPSVHGDGFEPPTCATMTP